MAGSAPPQISRRKLFDSLGSVADDFRFDQTTSDLFQRHATELQQLLDFYNPCTDDTRKQFKGKKIEFRDPKEESFVLKLSALWGLDEIKSFEIHRSFMKYEIRTTISIIQNPNFDFSFGSEELVDAATHFYFEERCYTLRTISALLRIASGDSDLALDLVRQIIGPPDQVHESAFVQSLLKQLEWSFTARIPSHIEGSGSRKYVWAKQYLHEQRGLLEILFLVFYDPAIATCPPKFVCQLVKLFAKCRFGKEQPNAVLFDDEAHAIWDHVAHLAVLISIMILDLGTLVGFRGNLPDAPDGESLLQSPECIADLTRFLIEYETESLGDTAEVYGPVLMAFSSFWARLSFALEEYCPDAYGGLLDSIILSDRQRSIPRDKISALLMQRAYSSQLHAVKYINHSLKMSICYSSEDHSTDGYKSVLKELFVLFSACYPVQNLPDFDLLIETVSLIYSGFTDICTQFWEVHVFDEDTRHLYDAVSSRFPVNALPFLQLVNSLVASPEHAYNVFDELQHMSRFTEVADATLFVGQDLNQIITKTGDLDTSEKGYPLYLTKYAHDVAPESQGRRVSPANQTPLVIQWAANYSAWLFFIDVIVRFLNTPASLHSDDQVQVIVAIVKLLCTVLKHLEQAPNDQTAVIEHLLEYRAPVTMGAESRQVFRMRGSDLVAMACSLIRYAGAMSKPAKELISNSFALLAILLPIFPEDVWRHLNQQALLPRSLAKGDRLATGAGSPPNFMQQVLLPLEKAAGSYPTTLNFLQLVESLLLEAQSHPLVVPEVIKIKADVLLSAIKYIHGEIFASYSSWRYVKVLQKYQIGLSITRIFHLILQDTTTVASACEGLVQAPETKHRPEVYLGVLQEYLIQTFLDHGSAHHFGSNSYLVNPLLDIIALGYQYPEDLMRRSRMAEYSVVEQSIAEALSVCEILLKVRIKASAKDGRIGGDRRSFLEHALLDRHVWSDKETSELVCVLASYIHYDYSITIPLLATKILTLLCAIASDWEPRPPSFASYFGDHAQIIVNAFLENLEDDIVPKAELQRSIFDFITGVVQTQPGLTTLFLKGDHRGAPGSNEPVDKLAPKPILKQTIRVDEAVSIAKPLLYLLKNWQFNMEHKPSLLPSLMRLLDVLWLNAPDFEALLKLLRPNPEFWQSLFGILESDLDTAERVEMLDIPSISDSDRVNIKCCAQVVKSHVLRLLASEIYFGTTLRKKTAGSGPADARDVPPTTLNKEVLNILKNSVMKNITTFQMGLSHDPQPYLASLHILEEGFKRRQAELGFERCLRFQDFKVLTWSDLFDAGRNFGSSYVYDIEIFKMKFDSLSPNDEHGLILTTSLINQVWSQADAETILFGSWKFLIDVLCTSHASWVWTAASLQSTTGIQEFPLEVLIQRATAELQSQVERSEAIYATHRYNLGQLVLFLTQTWVSGLGEKLCAGIGRDDNGALYLKKTISLVAQMSDCINNSANRMLDQHGRFLEQTFHTPVAAALLVTLRQLSSKKSAIPRESLQILGETVTGLFAPVSDGVASLLMVYLQEDLSAFCNDALSVFLSCLVELVRYDTQSRQQSGYSSRGLEFFVKHQTIPLLLRSFCKSMAVPTDQRPVHGELFLKALLGLAEPRSVAEQLASEGIIGALTNNNFTSALTNVNSQTPSHGFVPVYVAHGHERNPWHQIWCMMIQVTNRLLRHLASSQQFVQGVMSFVLLYWGPISYALDLSETSFRKDQTIALGWMEEVERITELFYLLTTPWTVMADERQAHEAHGAHGAHGNKKRGTAYNQYVINWTAFEAYRVLAVQILKTITFLFTHPNHFAKRIQHERAGRDDSEPLSQSMFAAGSIQSAVAEAARPARATRRTESLEECLSTVLQIVRNLVAHLRVVTDADRTILDPRKRTNPDTTLIDDFVTGLNQNERPYTLLFDIIEFMIDLVKNLMENTGQSQRLDADAGRAAPLEVVKQLVAAQPKKHGRNLVLTIEACLFLIVSQLANLLADPDIEMAAKKDVYRDTAHDLATIFASVQQRLKDAKSPGGRSPSAWWPEESQARTSEIVKFLEGFVRQLNSIGQSIPRRTDSHVFDLL
ncbi:nucleoporin subcomplex protein binding to Pom34-domain-containing protein [Polychytrium aggregatum]|uniref:nucleoporin subcomplex protein binding to Pom34-domain-containing protein n=1 Tax=Polychytrium aggregatum TaxID=110093 RepID=UPI0022FE48D6|nr:nucleoporin subcomplex protein binding to Pom34-domain-containing protein [Polychytrium aggregatum]KAI9206173.1 nucleoporin subcomplex protein binding to Pom34-domain-containing protein [Polychytrium aggregatum]